MKRCLVVICGYEGVEQIYGPFSSQEALAYGQELRHRIKRAALIWDTEQQWDHEFFELYEYPMPYVMRAELSEEVSNLGHYEPDQVCIQCDDSAA